MGMEGNILWTILAIALGLAALVAFSRKREEKVLTLNKNLAGFIGIILVVAILFQAGYLSGIGLTGLPFKAVTSTDKDEPPPNDGLGEAYQPTASYATKDKFSTTVVTGTSYYKVNELPATTTAKTNLRVGESYTYWVDNSTYYALPVVFSAIEGANDVVATAWNNNTATVTGYDLVNRQSTANGIYNTSLGANGQANQQVTYQGTAKKSASPFGGVFVVEFNSTISSVTCVGNELLADNPYHITYTVGSTARTYKIWAFSSALDDGSGSVRNIDCQFKNGATDIEAGAAYIFKFIPANYYITNNGDIALDTEKFKNDDTARTGQGQLSMTAYFS